VDIGQERDAEAGVRFCDGSSETRAASTIDYFKDLLTPGGGR
jgi:hypothetical protein